MIRSSGRLATDVAEVAVNTSTRILEANPMMDIRDMYSLPDESYSEGIHRF
jgi:hypothetical protein